jgi:hypothetical protein
MFHRTLSRFSQIVPAPRPPQLVLEFNLRRITRVEDLTLSHNGQLFHLGLLLLLLLLLSGCVLSSATSRLLR